MQRIELSKPANAGFVALSVNGLWMKVDYTPGVTLNPDLINIDWDPAITGYVLDADDYLTVDYNHAE